MHIDISCHHTSLTDGLRDAVTQKFSKLDQHTDRPLAAHVVLTVEKQSHVAEATLTVNGTPFHAKSKSKDMYAGLDQLVSRLDRAMRKAKTKRLQGVRGPVASLKQSSFA